MEIDALYVQLAYRIHETIGQPNDYGQANMTRSPVVSELDSSPTSTRIRASRTISSEAISELDGVNIYTNNTSPLLPDFPSMTSRMHRPRNTLGEAWRSTDTYITSDSNATGGDRISQCPGDMSSNSDKTLVSNI